MIPSSPPRNQTQNPKMAQTNPAIAIPLVRFGAGYIGLDTAPVGGYCDIAHSLSCSQRQSVTINLDLTC